MQVKHLAILGATGSIGRSTLAIVERFPEQFKVEALTAKRNVTQLAAQIHRFRPQLAAVYDDAAAQALSTVLKPGLATEIVVGEDGYTAAATLSDVDTVVAAMVGSAGLLPTLSAVRCGKRVALANKETLVMAGGVVMRAAEAAKAPILPVDSEHSAIFQCLMGQRVEDLDTILITASGGPFLDRDADSLHRVSPKDALQHPNWRMGPKISIDSATLMNKGLEVIEAGYLFNVDLDRIEILIHPQSIVHSMVAFRDGSVIAQLGVPDMKGAIAFALGYPERLAIDQPTPDFASLADLSFRKPDLIKFPCLALALDAARSGGTLPAVMNAANEIAVNGFLREQLSFMGISRTIESTMMKHENRMAPDLADILAADQWARRYAASQMRAHS